MSHHDIVPEARASSQSTDPSSRTVMRRVLVSSFTGEGPTDKLSSLMLRVVSDGGGDETSTSVEDERGVLLPSTSSLPLLLVTSIEQLVDKSW